MCDFPLTYRGELIDEGSRIQCRVEGVEDDEIASNELTNAA